MRSLWPREHGAYAQLAVPLLATRIPTVPAVLIGTGAILAFLANEPAIVLLGRRGKRARQELGDRARRRLVVLAVLGAIAGIAGIALAPATWVALPLLALPVGLALVLSWRGSAHTIAGELVAAVALTGASVPVAIANDAGLLVAVERWGAWSLGFTTCVVAVHHVIARRSRIAWSTVIVAAALAIAMIVPACRMAIPLCACGCATVAWSPHPRRLRAIGVAMVIASLASAV